MSDAEQSMSAMRHEDTKASYGWVTHTELASADPDATRTWCQAVLGWKFMPSFPAPAGDYHRFAYSEQGGGGIRHGVTIAIVRAPGGVPIGFSGP